MDCEARLTRASHAVADAGPLCVVLHRIDPGGQYAVVLLSYGYFKKCEGDHEELYILLLAAALGSSVLVAASHFVSFFLGLELLSVSLYGMIAYYAHAAASSGSRNQISGFGCGFCGVPAVRHGACLHGFGNNGIRAYGRACCDGEFSRELVVPGVALIMTGFGFKLAVVPFHFWTPDVYEGAPAPVAAYIATVSKGAMFALAITLFSRLRSQAFLRFGVGDLHDHCDRVDVHRQHPRATAKQRKANSGVLFDRPSRVYPRRVSSGRRFGRTAVTFYLVAYFITMLGAFGVVTVLSKRDERCRQPGRLSWTLLAEAGIGAVFSR